MSLGVGDKLLPHLDVRKYPVLTQLNFFSIMVIVPQGELTGPWK